MADQNADAVAITGGTAYSLTALGIGVIPDYQFEVKSTLSGTTKGSNQIGRIYSNGAGRDAHIRLGDNYNSSAWIGYLSGALYFGTGGSSKLELSLSGGLGIGVSPSSWGTIKGMEFGSVGSSVYGGGSANINVCANSYYNAGDVYALSGYPATKYESSGGEHLLKIAASGTAGNAITWTTAFKVDPNGNALVVSSGGIGYGTGSGGTVTQGTSRTTGVTLNKTNGAITLVSAAGSTSWQSFTLTNNTIAATDTVRVCQKSGTDLYQIHVTAVAAGSCQITFATTGGTTTEQPVFNFAVIKGVTS